jgi:hypothetical protein
MTDDPLVTVFEKGETPAGGFHHADHVHVAWWYLTQHPLPEALTRFSDALKRFALAQGKPDLYHETITTAYVLLINERLGHNDRSVPWESFVEQNADLFRWRPSVLDRYYYPETLASERAKRVFVLPDRLALTDTPGT